MLQEMYLVAMSRNFKSKTVEFEKKLSQIRVFGNRILPKIYKNLMKFTNFFFGQISMCEIKFSHIEKRQKYITNQLVIK
jgi:hypothetical protein